MTISVIIPSYNYGHFLGEAIDSVMQQTVPASEIIIVDDGSTDNTQQVVQKYAGQIRYIYQDNAGIGAARNLGVQHAKGNYIAFLDADDLWSADKLERQVAIVSEDDSVDMVFGHAKQFYCPKISVEAKSKLKCPDALIPGLIASTMLVKADKLREVGEFDTTLSTGEFIAWYMKAQKLGLKQVLLDDLFLMRRIHDGHLTVRTRRDYQDYLKILRAKIHSQESKIT